MLNNSILVFTPTYNRAYILPKLFESLKRQTNANFSWLIIDDGSSDNTREVVEEFQKSTCFRIEYVYQKNGGKHVAINHMLDIAESDLVLIVDSDDYLSNDAIDTIINDYNRLTEKSSLCEMIYLRGYPDTNKPIGSGFVDTNILVDPIEYFINGKASGDKVSIISLKIWKKYRFPIFNNENFMGEDVLWHEVYRDKYKAYISNKIIYYCEYREDGLSLAGRSMRLNNPWGGMEHAKAFSTKGLHFDIRAKYSVLYSCYSKFAGLKIHEAAKNFKNGNGMFLLGYIPGIILYNYWKRKYLK